jgi:hypothetical protein
VDSISGTWELTTVTGVTFEDYGFISVDFTDGIGILNYSYVGMDTVFTDMFYYSMSNGLVTTWDSWLFGNTTYSSENAFFDDKMTWCDETGATELFIFEQ